MIVAGSLRRIREELGAIGMMALGLLAGAMVFLTVVVKPLETRNAQLEQRLARNSQKYPSPGSAAARTPVPAAKIAAFYKFFETDEATTGWLVRLHAIGSAAGVELQSAEYRMQKTGTIIERYEISLPVTGSYAQIRLFLEKALTEIPVLSLDQVNFRRARANEDAVRADVRFTLHLLRS
jgi:hypothetical protein